MPKSSIQTVASGAALLVLPMVAVGLTALTASMRKPAHAAADTGPGLIAGPATTNGKPMKTLTDDPDLRARLSTLHDAPVGPCPVRPMQIIAPPSAIERAVNGSPADIPGVPKLTLTSIINGSAGAMATINGKLRKPGDQAAPGWTLLSIDAATGHAVLSGPENQTIELAIVRKH